MIREEMPSTLLAELPDAVVGLVVNTYLVGALGDGERARLPEGEGVHWAGGPVSARRAMAVPHCLRFSGDLELDRSTETTPLVLILDRHGFALLHGSGSHRDALRRVLGVRHPAAPQGNHIAPGGQ